MPSAGQNGEQREKSSTFLMPESQADMMKIQQRRAEKKALKAEKKAEKKAAKKAAKKKKSRKNSRSASSEEGGSEVDQVDHHQPLMTGPSQSQLETTSQARLELSLNTTPGQEEDHLQESNQESEDGESKVEDEEDGETVVVPNR